MLNFLFHRHHTSAKHEAGSCFALLSHRNKYKISNVLLVPGIRTFLCDRPTWEQHNPSLDQQQRYPRAGLHSCFAGKGKTWASTRRSPAKYVCRSLDTEDHVLRATLKRRSCVFRWQFQVHGRVLSPSWYLLAQGGQLRLPSLAEVLLQCQS